MTQQQTPMISEERRALDALMDALLPGGSGFPAATKTGMGDMLTARLAAAEPSTMAQLLALTDSRKGQPIDAAGWRAAAERIAAVNPKLFDAFRKHVYLTYYEQDSVLAAIRASGVPYNDKPLPDGYPGPRFEPVRDSPSHQRGRWIPTNEVKRVDLDGLDLGDVA